MTHKKEKVVFIIHENCDNFIIGTLFRSTKSLRFWRYSQIHVINMIIFSNPWIVQDITESLRKRLVYNARRLKYVFVPGPQGLISLLIGLLFMTEYSWQPKSVIFIMHTKIGKVLALRDNIEPRQDKSRVLKSTLCCGVLWLATQPYLEYPSGCCQTHWLEYF